MSRLIERLRRPGADGTANRWMRDVVGNKTDAAVSIIDTDVSLMGYTKGIARGAQQITLKSTGDLVASGTTVDLFTVTGDILCMVCGSVDVAVTCTSGTSTAEVGIAGATAILCVQDAIDGTAFDVGDAWTLLTAPDDNGAAMPDEWVLIGNGADIIMTVSVDDILTGDIDFYCFWIPLSADAAVVAA